MLTEAYLEPTQTSTMELFSLWLSHILKMYLSSFFYTTHPFVKKTYNSENVGSKSLLLTIEHFFSKFKITLWNGTINKQKQKQPPEVFYKKMCS